MKKDEDKQKSNQRKKEINYYHIFNDKGGQLQNKISIIFEEYLDSFKRKWVNVF